jgi:hypothetical protein
MAFLVRSRAARAASLALLLACAACAMLRDWLPGTRRFAFSHEQHVTLEKLACANCHADALASDSPGMPGPDTCDVCHAETDAQKPPERKVASLFHGQDFAALHATKLGGELVFSHKLHAAGKQACEDCHYGIAHSQDVAQLAPLRMDDCTRCHEQRSVGAGAGCAQCHRAITREWAPASHRSNWIRAHGLAARAKSEESAMRCVLCHTSASCDECHRAQPPENHTPYWYERGHGLVAMSDRMNCAACHQPESCESCHAVTQPRNHVGSWGGTLATHCLTCHEPLRYEECSTCHKATPSHNSAAHQPPDHFPGMNCRQCHGLTAPLPHVDNGDDCSSCHH